MSEKENAKNISLKEAYINFWKKYFVWKERAGRAEFWWPILVNALIVILLSAVIRYFSVSPLILGLFELAVFIPTISILVRRLHDVGRSAWLAFSSLIVIFLLVISSATKSTLAYAGTVSPLYSQINSIIIIIGGFTLVALYIAIFVFCCLPGTKGANKYGAA